MSPISKMAAVSNECVACGCCVKICPLSAIFVHNGIIAKVDGTKCIGCGKCAKNCPACVISIVPKENCLTGRIGSNEEKTLV